MFDRARIENLLPNIGDAEVAHYTRIGTLCHFIPSGSHEWVSAWATPVQFLNDRMELALGLEVLKEVSNQPPISGKVVRAIIDQLLTTSGRLETDAYQMSFSGNADELGQWRGYASNGMGCAVVTSALAVQKVADIAGWVVYSPKNQRAFAYKILNDLRREKDRIVIEKMLIAAACYMKHDGFRPEKEFRMIVFPDSGSIKFREAGDRLVPYVDYLDDKKSLRVNRIVIGPGWQLAGLPAEDLMKHHVVQGIHRLLSARGLDAIVSIQSSSIPYDPK